VYGSGIFRQIFILVGFSSPVNRTTWFWSFIDSRRSKKVKRSDGGIPALQM